MALYTVSHTNPDGKSGVAAALIGAKNYSHLVKKFERMFPQRVLSQVGELGKEG